MLQTNLDISDLQCTMTRFSLDISDLDPLGARFDGLRRRIAGGGKGASCNASP